MTSAKSKTPEGVAPAPSTESDAAAPSTAAGAETPTNERAPQTIAEAYVLEREKYPEDSRALLDALFAELPQLPDETPDDYEVRVEAYGAERGWVLDDDGLPHLPVQLGGAPGPDVNPAAEPNTGPSADYQFADSLPAEDVSCAHGFPRGHTCPSGCWSPGGAGAAVAEPVES